MAFSYSASDSHRHSAPVRRLGNLHLKYNGSRRGAASRAPAGEVMAVRPAVKSSSSREEKYS